MIQIAIVSGKGGTGKTTLAGSLSELFNNHVMADCDVDASNLHLLINADINEKFEYFGGKKAHIDQDACISCGICLENCRFDAIYIKDEKYIIDEYACEGCGVCAYLCPVDAIELNESKAGEYYVSFSNKLPLVHAELIPGEETSGGLVAEVRKKAVSVAEENNKEVVIIDGAPGIGCPATSSITGVSFVIIVTEPTQSGLHDLKRIIETVELFRREFAIVINKYDINTEKTKELENFCKENGYEIISKIPFDEYVVKATAEGVPVVKYTNSKASKEILKIYEYLKNRFNL